MFSLAFMLIGSFGFANTEIEKSNETFKNVSFDNVQTFLFEQDNDIDGCWVYVRFVDADGNTVGRGRYWDSSCTEVGGRGRTIVV